MRRTPSVVLSAATVASVAAFGMSGCGDHAPTAEPATSRARAVTAPPAPSTPDAAPLPAPEALAGVLQQLADPAVPPERKVGLVQYGTAQDQPLLQNFAEALAANGYDPLGVTVTDLSWAAQPGNVTAIVTLAPPNPGPATFTYPMEFSPMRDGWQLARRTADQLLPALGGTAPPGSAAPAQPGSAPTPPP